jgi:osmotically inducible protein OsmC
VRTTATVTLEPVDGAQTVTRIDLDTVARVPNISADEFQKQADAAKVGCPISRLLKAAEIRLNAKLA